MREESNGCGPDAVARPRGAIPGDGPQAGDLGNRDDRLPATKSSMTDQPSAQHASRSEAIDRTLAEFRASRRGEPGVVIARGDGESLDCSVVFPFEMTPVCTPNRTRISWYAADVLFV